MGSKQLFKLANPEETPAKVISAILEDIRKGGVELTKNYVLDDDLKSGLQLLVKLCGQQTHGVPLELGLVKCFKSFDDLGLHVHAFSLLTKSDDVHVEFIFEVGLQVDGLDLFHDRLECTDHVAVDNHAHHQDQQSVQHRS